MQYQVLNGLDPEYIESLRSRFWAKVDRRGVDDCWEWQASLMRSGYGQIGIGDGKPFGAHRVAYELEIGPIPAGMMVCHECDNPKCVNPKHLFAGTGRDNADDMIGKGRKAEVRGPRSTSKLNEQLVRQLRQDYQSGQFTNQQLAKKYDVHETYVPLVANGYYWSYVK